MTLGKDCISYVNTTKGVGLRLRLRTRLLLSQLSSVPCHIRYSFRLCLGCCHSVVD